VTLLAPDRHERCDFANHCLGEHDPEYYGHLPLPSHVEWRRGFGGFDQNHDGDAPPTWTQSSSHPAALVAIAFKEATATAGSASITLILN
jgi:hypothetical protein